MGTESAGRAAGLTAALLAGLVAAGCTTVTFPDPGRSVDPGLAAGGLDVRPPSGREPPAGLPRSRGEGRLTVSMSAPGTSWKSTSDTAVVVEATVDGGTPQTFVLFAGATPYAYTGFTGPLAHRPARRLAHGARRPLDHDQHADRSVHGIDLTVVPTTDPGYRAIAHAPVLYGRGVNAHSDTPLLQFVADDPAAGGGRRLTYTTTWSNEDSGTGIIPWLLWGGYGRTTDIETTAIVNLDASGSVTSATFQTCAACPPDYPENQVGLDHSYATFAGTYFGGHPVLRVATGNNVLKDTGTTAVPLPPGTRPRPAPG